MICNENGEVLHNSHQYRAQADMKLKKKSTTSNSCNMKLFYLLLLHGFMSKQLINIFFAA